MKIIVFSTMIIYFLLLVNYGQAAALLITTVWVIVCSIFFIRLFYRNRLKKYGLMLENIYEYQQSPSDKNVLIRAREHERLINLSGNEMGVKVFTIFFQDSINPNENWEEYIDRKDAFIANDRTLRHQDLEKSQGRKYYLAELHGQKGALN